MTDSSATAREMHLNTLAGRVKKETASPDEDLRKAIVYLVWAADILKNDTAK